MRNTYRATTNAICKTATLEPTKVSSTHIYFRSKLAGGQQDRELFRMSNKSDTVRDSGAVKRAVDDGGSSDEEPKKKISFGLGKANSTRGPINLAADNKPAAKGIAIKLGAPKQSAPQPSAPTLKPKSESAAAAFNSDDDDEEEEMPPEAKMRMRNIGRDTPTSAGPNSFGKTRMGFCDSKKIYEKKLKEIQDKLAEDD
ncbi:PEST proteolytic signal-containing nuclear protein-like isoform X2 [Oratosquilla oratoria]|uniref:PEST proteolytic signal-containing nuclear protein-like isoform X2 n=1 Tax=Oratosquilla oratoria TaxID=337810 RepID=UPI003F774990